MTIDHLSVMGTIELHVMNLFVPIGPETDSSLMYEE